MTQGSFYSTGAKGGPDLRPALSRLVTVFPAIFGAEYWGQKPLLSRASELAQDFSDLFSADAVDELVADRGIRTPFARMAKEGTVLGTRQFTGSGGFGAEIADQVDADKVLREFTDGSTLVLQGLHKTWAPLAEFTRQLIADVGHPSQVNAYITPASSRGFDPHYDVHDVFVIQIAGEKRWTIHEPVHRDPLGNEPWTDHKDAVIERAKHTPYLEETFAPGDVLYLPRGWIHSATALGDFSIHLTIGVSAHTRSELAERMIARLTASPSLRAALPMSVDRMDPARLQAIVREATEDLIELLAGDDFADDIAAEAAADFAGAIRPEPVHPLAVVTALGELSGGTVVAWRRGLARDLTKTGGHVVIAVGARSVSLPIEAAAAVEALASGDPFRVGDLPELDAASAVVVARRLVREAILTVR
ncbi:MAG TPA: cupin domain-containing protein [Galbitalea sp.]